MQGEIDARISEVRGRIARAADRCGRDPAEIHLIGAAKTMPPAVVRAAIEAGLTDVGENYVQEAIEAKTAVDSVGLGAAVRWHLIGHLQRNKAKRAVELFDVVQTVDRVALGRALARHAAEQGKVLSVLIEVNLAAEPSKSGVAPDELGALVTELRNEAALSLDGLMAIPPVAGETEARGYFRRLRELRDQHGLRELSMGMTNDFEIAIEEGATMIRVGRAIFGERGS
jgi:hypothetical protein